MSSTPSVLTCARPAAMRGMDIGWAIDEIVTVSLDLLHHKLLQICATSSMAAYIFCDCDPSHVALHKDGQE